MKQLSLATKMNNSKGSRERDEGFLHNMENVNGAY